MIVKKTIDKGVFSKKFKKLNELPRSRADGVSQIG